MIFKYANDISAYMHYKDAPMCRDDELIKILLVDDHKLVREGICSILRNQPGLEVVGEADNGRLALELTKELQPHVVVMDISMPDMNGFEATRRIAVENPASKVIALSVHADRQSIVEVIKAGAKGYLLKNCSTQELVDAIYAVAAGELYFAPKTCEQLIREFVQTGDKTAQPFTLLTSREREVLQLLAEGRNTKEIAFTLDVSVKTIEFHRQQIMKKLDLYSLPELTKYAVREGITSL
jgi:DNA-binding NarL/FixJ family response regulator